MNHTLSVRTRWALALARIGVWDPCGLLKKAALLATLALSHGTAFGQGWVCLNTVSTDAYVRYGFINGLTGESGWCSGERFYAGLYWATDRRTLETGGGTLVRGGGTNDTGLAVFTTSPDGFVSTITFGGNRRLFERAGQLTFFQLRAWSAPYERWEAVMATGSWHDYWTCVSGGCGSPIVTATPTADPLSPVPQILWAPGSSSADPRVVMMVVIPEPNSLALLALGGLLLAAWHGRRGTKQR
ncbi:MAG: PEP-CTERM sorting domain-containing protein [Verrucomicrobia bacterium]|nr:PEP-CTERM sorting domain-containing protein [Verrucomicrobiota bacterium]